MKLLLLSDYLMCALELGISQLFFSPGCPVSYKDSAGLLIPITPEERPLTTDNLESLVLHNAVKEQRDKDKLTETGEVETHLSIAGKMRSRVNAFVQRNTYAMVITILTVDIDTPIRPLNDWSLDLTPLQKWPSDALCIITGHSGQDCAELAASLADYYNRSFPCHILTLEDMTTTLHRHQRAIVNQRELPRDLQDSREVINRVKNLGADVCLVNSSRNETLFPQLAELAHSGITVIAVFSLASLELLRQTLIDLLPQHQAKDLRQRVLGANCLCVELDSGIVVDGGTWLADS